MANPRSHVQVKFMTKLISIKAQIVDSVDQYALNMTFKLLSTVKGKCDANKSLVCHGLPLFQWENIIRGEKKKRLSAADRFARNGHGEKGVIKKLLHEDDQDKSLFIYQRSKNSSRHKQRSYRQV